MYEKLKTDVIYLLVHFHIVNDYNINKNEYVAYSVCYLLQPFEFNTDKLNYVPCM